MTSLKPACNWGAPSLWWSNTRHLWPLQVHRSPPMQWGAMSDDSKLFLQEGDILAEQTQSEQFLRQKNFQHCFSFLSIFFEGSQKISSFHGGRLRRPEAEVHQSLGRTSSTWALPLPPVGLFLSWGLNEQLNGLLALCFTLHIFLRHDFKDTVNFPLALSNTSYYCRLI